MAGLVVLLALMASPDSGDALPESSSPGSEIPVLRIYDGPGRAELDRGRDLTWGGGVLVGAGVLSAGFTGWGMGTYLSGTRGLESDRCETDADKICSFHRTNSTRGRKMVIGFGVTTGVLLSAGVGLLIAGRAWHKFGKQLERRAALSATGIALKF